MTRATTFRATAIVGGFLLALLMIMTVSRAAFTATTENTGNTWGAGVLELTDDDSGFALFEVDDIAPGDSGSNCIAVIHSGVDADVLMSAIASGGTGLQSRLDVSVTRFAGGDCNSGASWPVYGGKLNAFTGDASPTWDTAVLGHTQHYLITWSLPETVGNGAQGLSATAEFTWQATSN